jgi:hypothetical protein
MPVVAPPPKVQPRFKRSFPTRSAIIRPRRVDRGAISLSPPA